MKPWRPDNWDEHLSKAQDDRIGTEWLSDQTYRGLMEIGADAMLEALKKRAIFVHRGHTVIGVNEITMNKQGFLIFIEEEK